MARHQASILSLLAWRSERSGHLLASRSTSETISSTTGPAHRAEVRFLGAGWADAPTYPPSAEILAHPLNLIAVLGRHDDHLPWIPRHPRIDASNPSVTSGIYPSDNPDDWLGEGTYFFIEGLDDPRTSAAQWARCKAWDKLDQEFDESTVAVIEAAITVEPSAIFDLREPSNAQHFHRVRRRWLKSLVPRRSTHLPRPEKDRFDTDLLDQFKQENGIAALIGDFHIQFSLRERHFRLDSRIPNVTVLCLSNGISQPRPKSSM